MRGPLTGPRVDAAGPPAQQHAGGSMSYCRVLMLSIVFLCLNTAHIFMLFVGFVDTHNLYLSLSLYIYIYIYIYMYMYIYSRIATCRWGSLWP